MCSSLAGMIETSPHALALAKTYGGTAFLYDFLIIQYDMLYDMPCALS